MINEMTLQQLQEIYAENMAAEIEGRKPFGWGKPFGNEKVEALEAYDVKNLENAYSYVCGYMESPYSEFKAYIKNNVIIFNEYC